MTIAILVSREVGNLFSRSLYAKACRSHQIPVLREDCPDATKELPCHNCMANQVVSLQTISDVESIRKALLSLHHGFPVVNTAGKLVGRIPQSMLVKLLKKKVFYKKERIDRKSIVSRETEDKGGIERAFTNKRNSIN